MPCWRIPYNQLQAGVIPENRPGTLRCLLRALLVPDSLLQRNRLEPYHV